MDEPDAAPLPAPPPPTTVGDEHRHEPPEGSAEATLALSPSERRRLGLSDNAGGAIDPAALPQLTKDQWADPEVVAARFALVRTNFRADDDPDLVRARWSSYVVPQLKNTPASSSGGQVLAELRAQRAVFTGDVIGLVTTERSERRAVVELTVQRHTHALSTVRGQVVFWRLTLLRVAESERWLVAAVEPS